MIKFLQVFNNIVTIVLPFMSFILAFWAIFTNKTTDALMWAIIGTLSLRDLERLVTHDS